MTPVDTLPSETDAIPPRTKPGRLDASAWSWALYQGGRDPYIGLVSGFIFVPYFAMNVIGDPVRGQSFIADVGRTSGLIIAILTPILGATVDQIGPRKPWLLLITVLLAPLMAVLWFAAPGPTGLSIGLVSAILVASAILLSCIDVVHSSMLPSAAVPAARSGASGQALALGNVTSIAAMLFMLVAFMIPDHPWLGLSKASFEPDRIVGPVCAIVYVACAAPLFLFSRDAPKGKPANLRAVTSGLSAMWDLIRHAREHSNALIYLVVRTVSQDAGFVLLTLSGVYAAGVMRWNGTEMLILGLLGCVAGMFGGWAASWFDRVLGLRGALQIEIFGSIIGLVGMIGTSPSMIAFVSVSPGVAVWNGPYFRTAPELAFQLWSFLGNFFQIAAWASSRTLLVKLAPASRVGSFFGLAALAGACTGWIGPTLVGVFTKAFQSQQAGFYPIAVLLALGFGGLFLVHGGDRSDAAADQPPPR